MAISTAPAASGFAGVAGFTNDPNRPKSEIEVLNEKASNGQPLTLQEKEKLKGYLYAQGTRLDPAQQSAYFKKVDAGIDALPTALTPQDAKNLAGNIVGAFSSEIQGG